MPLNNPRFKNNSRLQQASNNNPSMTRGEHDRAAVAIIQQALVDLGYFMPRSTLPDGTLDGDYGRETSQMVRRFQRDNNLQVDGRIGRNTIHKLDALAPSSGTSAAPDNQPPITPSTPSSTGKSVILTFDDGPEPTTALNNTLTILRQNNIRAEFYVLGKEVTRNRTATKGIVDQGHTVQNHSWSHTNLASASEARVRSELQRTQDAILNATGVMATKLRPPYGAGGWSNNPDRELSRVARSLSLEVENWDVDTEDWKRPAGLHSSRLSMIKSQLRGRSNQSNINILMHVKASTARDLPNFIRKLQQWGYSFGLPV